MEFSGFSNVTDILRPGIYMLLVKGQVIYVGKSKAMISRINNHRSVWKDKRRGKDSWVSDMLGIPGILFDEIHVRPSRPDQLDALEREMIDRYRPKFNQKLRGKGIIKAPISLVIGRTQLMLNAPKQSHEPIRRRI